MLSRIIRVPFERFVQGGSWDREGFPIQAHRSYRVVNDLYTHRTDFRQSDTYKNARESLRRDGHFQRKKRTASTIEELDTLFQEDLVTLINSMEKNGYEIDRSPDHCRVMITAQGTLVKTQRGGHRFAAAQLTGVTSVPVIVFRIHRTWLKTVQGGFRGEKLENLRRALREVEARYQ
ncbi:MAG: hypothetical protein EA427_15760 [Spirochaetaceae bacterium]|nr:MAG: hypothetical protein EA427_15760 [Spirochaetaceae bacterium]